MADQPRYRIKVNGEQINLMPLDQADALYESLKKTCKPGDVITLERESNGEVTSRYVVPVPVPEVEQLRARVAELQGKIDAIRKVVM